MADEFDQLFRGVSGLMDDVDVEWLNAVFRREPKFANENGVPIVLAVDLFDGDETKAEMFSIGNGWETEDGGARVVRESGETRGFNESTKLQKILTRLLDLDEDAVRAQYEKVGVGPQSAVFWEGLKVHMKREEYVVSFGAKKGETAKELMPTAILGWGGEASKPAAPAKKAAKKVTKAAKKTAEEPAGEPESNGELKGAELSALKLAIRNIADECETFDEFIDRCYAEVDGVDGEHQAQVQALIDDEDGPTSIWAEAVRAAEG